MDSSTFKEFSALGIVIGFAFWVALLWYVAEDLECMRHNACTSGDMVMFAVLSVGYLVPASIVALIVSTFTKRK